MKIRRGIMVIVVILIIVITGFFFIEKSGLLDRSIIIPKPLATSLVSSTFFSCESLVDADIDTGLFPPYDKVSGRTSNLNSKYPVQIEGESLFLTGYNGRRFGYQIFSNDSDFLGAAKIYPGSFGPSAHTIVINKSTGLGVLTETTINGGSNDPVAGVSYMVCR